MQIDLPADIVARLQQRTASSTGETEADVIRMALDSLDRQDTECKAIQEGVDAWNSGAVVEFDEFDREFRQKNGIAPGA